MGKVASDKCHKWVFKEPSESEPNLANYWQSSFDAVCSLNLPQIFKSIFGYKYVLPYTFCFLVVHKFIAASFRMDRPIRIRHSGQ